MIRDHKVCRVREETEGAKGHLGRVDRQVYEGIKGQQGLVGLKGEPGIVGNQGRKGEKGEKGESTKASQASVVPQTNWKQCVWKSNSGTDNGKIKVNKNFGSCEPSVQVSLIKQKYTSTNNDEGN